MNVTVDLNNRFSHLDPFQRLCTYLVRAFRRFPVNTRLSRGLPVPKGRWPKTFALPCAFAHSYPFTSLATLDRCKSLRASLFLDSPSYNSREKTRNSVQIIKMMDKSTEIVDPSQPDAEPKRFAFDYSYWSHDGFEEKSDGYLSPTTPNYADQVA